MSFYRSARPIIGLLGAAALMLVTSQVNAESVHMHSGNMGSGHATLTEPGQDAFGTLQEVIRKLQADPNTDWSKVNLEALRQHLIDMDNFTMQVSVVSKRNIESGVELRVRPDNARARQSLEAGLSAHPGMLKQEIGWDMTVNKSGSDYVLKIISPDKKHADQIRGLGYIGIMALGNHHQAHHWAMAKGGNPHQ